MRMGETTKAKACGLIVLSLLLCLPAPVSSMVRLTQQQAQTEPPITKEGLIRTLRSRTKGVTVEGLIRRIETRKVAFMLTPEDEQEIRTAGNYFKKRELDALVNKVRGSFLASSKTPLRVTYTLLDGYAIDLFLRGQINRRMSAETGNAFIIKNSAFKTLSYLVNNFSVVKEDYELTAFHVTDGEKSYSARRLANSYVRNRRGLFVGSGDEGLAWHTMIVQQESLPDLVNSLNDPAQPWRTFLNVLELQTGQTTEVRQQETESLRRSRRRRSGVIQRSRKMNSFLFRKFAERSDLERVEPDTLADFYLYVTRNYMPPDFAELELALAVRTSDDDGCELPSDAAGTVSTYSTLHGPFLSLRIALIENTSPQSVRLGKFIVKENRSEQLRRRQEDQETLVAQTPRRENLFPLITLKPGEKIAIPIEMLIKRGDEELTARREASPIPGEAIDELKRNGGMVFPLIEETSKTEIKIKAEVIENIINRPKIDFTAAKEYVYGPSFEIEAVEIENRDYLFRKGDPRNLVITAEGEGGSCPYIYTYSASRKSWLTQGVILHNVNKKEKETTDEKPLLEFDGRILIKEKDPEDSFIDSMFIRAISPDGSETILYPQNKKLRHSDEDYLKLKQGEQLIVNFNLPKNFISRKYVLVAKGYYIPYRQIPARSKPMNSR